MVFGFQRLVLWNIYDFPYIGNVIIPTDELIFFRGVAQPPTSLMFYVQLHVGNQLSPTFSRAQPPFMTRMVRAKLSSRIAGTVGRGLPPFSYVPWSS